MARWSASSRVARSPSASRRTGSSGRCASPPAGDGTRLVQRRETPDGISALSRELVDAYLGGRSAFTASMQEGMTATLASIKATAEADQEADF